MDVSVDSLVESVIGAVFEVSNTLGAGFLEKVYERALLRELKIQGIESRAQATFPVIYKEQNVGDYFADILVEGRLVVELKCVDRLTNEHNEHMAQCLNYLKVSKMTLCLLVNFQKPVVEWRRIVLNHPSSLYWAADERMINADKTKQDFLSDNSNLFRVEFLDMIASSFHDH